MLVGAERCGYQSKALVVQLAVIKGTQGELAWLFRCSDFLGNVSMSNNQIQKHNVDEREKNLISYNGYRTRVNGVEALIRRLIICLWCKGPQKRKHYWQAETFARSICLLQENVSLKVQKLFLLLERKNVSATNVCMQCAQTGKH